jgi:uncharacterized membrane protein YvbJ
VVGLVYCSKCGTENEDDAVECKNCGAPLRRPAYRKYRRRYEDEICFGARGGIPILGVLIGLIIILWGVSSLLGSVFRWAVWGRLWPFLIIALGLLIVFNVLSRR